MKAKRLTALALAALMAASTTSVALAGERVDADLDFANDGYYKYNSDTNRLESAKRDEFQPGDDVYLRLVEDSHDTFTNKKTYNAYADWTIGDSWVKDIDVVYRKGDITTSTSTTYDWTFNGGSSGVLAGWTASGTGLASQDNSAVKTALKGKPEFSQYVDKYINDNYIKIPAADNAWTDNQGRYWLNEANAKAGNDITGDIDTWSLQGDEDQYSSKEELITGENLELIKNSYFVYNKQAVHKTLEDLIKSLSGQSTKSIWIQDSSTFGKDFKESSGVVGYSNEITAYVFEIGGQKYFVKSDAVGSVIYDNLTGLGITTIEKGDKYLTDYFNNQSGVFVADATIEHTQKNVEAQMAEKGVQQVVGDKYLNKGGKEGDKFVTENVETTATNAVTSAIDSADSSIVWKSNTVTNTQPQYEYWVKITTKDSATTKDIDVVGSIWVGTSKSSAKKEKDGSEDKFRADFTLTNSDPGNDDYDEATDYVSIEPGERAVVSFADDASDEFEVEFGDDARFVFNARGQGKLNLAYNTKYNKDFAYDYDDANIDFINFEGEPTTNRTGTLYIYADEDSYIYEVTSKGAKKINGAYYDDDEEAWVIRTRNLTSYAISDKKLKTVDQMDNGSSSSSGSNSGSNSGSGSNNGKPNPDTGR